MKINKVLSIFIALVMLVTTLSTTVCAFSKTTTEDGVVIVEDTSGKKNRYVYYPEELTSNSKKYPLIIWANGTGCRQSLYKELLKGLAKEGYVVVSSDETMAADGKDQSASLDYVIKKSKTSSNILYKRLNTDKVTAMGHSQGGRSAVNVACSDARFCCVVSIAGSNYQNEAELLKAPTLFLTGTSDGMVDSAKWVKPAYDACKGAAAYASLIGANHTACCNSPEKYIPYCVLWIKAWTNEDDDALSVFKAKGALSKDSDWTDVTRKNLTNNISGCITLSATEFVYSGKAKKPSVNVKNYRGAVINSDNYKVIYDKGCKNVGKYKVTVKYCNKYSGSETLYFVINPKATKLTKLTPDKGGFKASWSKQSSQASGYQLQYSTSEKFTKPKSVTIKDSKKNSCKLAKLSKGKKYFVRVRTYKTVGKTTFYSAWSSAKSVTTGK